MIIKTIKRSLAPRVILALPVILLLASTQIAGAGTLQPRIIGGQNAANDAWPSTVALVRNGNNSLFDRQFCGANLIGDKWVLTAAHCLFDANMQLIDPSTIRATVGVTDLNNPQGATEMVVTNLFVHPQYDPSEVNAYHDVAVLELAQLTTQPTMSLFSGASDSDPGTMATVVGWGSLVFNEDGSYVFPSILNQVTVPVESREVCNAVESYDGILSPGQMCAGLAAGGKDSCVGDSGGPLMVVENGGFTQAGIVSFGIGCALPAKYGIYTSIAYYRGWIEDVLGGEVEPGTYQAANDSDRLLFDNGSGSTGLLMLAGLFTVSFFRYRRREDQPV